MLWTAKFKVKHKGCWILPRTVKYNLTVTGIPLSMYEEKGEKFHSNISFLKGEEKNKKKYIADLKKDPNVVNFQIRGDQIFALVKGSDFISHYFDPSFFFIKPVVHKQGYEYWQLGCWQRKRLMKFYKDIKKIAEVKILQLKKGMPDVFIQHALPKLTKKQRKAFEFAHENGYYSYPRKTSVEKLAELLKVPRSTFQEHLRKAEAKMMDVLVETTTK